MVHMIIHVCSKLSMALLSSTSDYSKFWFHIRLYFDAPVLLTLLEWLQNINVNSTEASHKRWVQTFSVMSNELTEVQLAVKEIREKFTSSNLVCRSKVRLLYLPAYAVCWNA